METTSSGVPQEFAVVNPASGEEVARYPLMGADEVDRAVFRARELAPGWGGSGFAERKRIFLAAAALLAENAERYAGIVASETGKTVMDAVMADVFPSADLLRFYGRRLKKFLKPARAEGSIFLPGRKSYYLFEPKGVVGVVSPWNYPLTLSAGPALSALAAGNAVVLKPSSQTTGSGLIVKEVLEQAGLPRDIIQVVTGNGSLTGQALVEHPGLDMIVFTGSTPVGREVNIKAASRLIPTIMELGGKDVSIVTRSADLDRAAHGIAWGAFTNSGQTCIGVEVALVDRSVFERFLEKLVALTGSLKSGDRAGEVGSMTMASQLEVVEDQVEDALKKGARILTGGSRDPARPGLFYPPTILVDTTPEMKVRSEETFGPLLPVVPYDTLEEALALANRPPYGLSGSVFTGDLAEGRRLARGLDAGSVNINDLLITYANPSLPFGGNKESGVGRYHGEMGLRAFTNIKSITEFSGRWKKEPYWYPLPRGFDRAALAALPAFFSRRPGRRLAGAVKALAEIVRSRRKG